MNVKFEGNLVTRHLDITTSNHSSEPGATPPMPGIESMTGPGSGDDDDDDKPKCPCCGDDAHPNQLGEDGKLSPTKPEANYYDDKAAEHIKRRGQMEKVLAGNNPPSWAGKLANDPNPAYAGLTVSEVIIRNGNDMEAAAKELASLRSANSDCPNLHDPADEGCGPHFEPNGKAADARKEFDKIRTRYVKDFKRNNPDAGVTNSSQINHKTPLDAGGCPVSPNNLIPDPVLSGDCAKIESLQTKLQSL